MHRGDLQMVLYEACKQRIGAEKILLCWKCTGFSQDASGATTYFQSPTSEALPP